MASKTPVILTDEQRATLGRVPDDLTDTEIGRYYTLGQDELRAAKSYREAADRLGFAIQLGVLHFPGRPWRNLNNIPARVVAYLAYQIGEQPETLLEYAKRYQTGNEHLDKICAQFAYQQWDGIALLSLTRELLPCAMESDHSLWLMQEALAILRRKRILVPAISTVEGRAVQNGG